MSWPKVAIRGCPRSGTHTSEWFIDIHCNTTHGFTRSTRRHRDWEQGDPEKLFVVFKDPVSWVISMHRYSWKVGTQRSSGRLDQVKIDLETYKIADTADDFWLQNATTLTRNRNNQMKQWAECGADTFFCPYETMVGNPELVIKLLRIWLPYYEFLGFLGFPESSMTVPGSDRQIYGLDYYLDEMWRREMILKNQLAIRAAIND